MFKELVLTPLSFAASVGCVIVTLPHQFLFRLSISSWTCMAVSVSVPDPSQKDSGAVSPLDDEIVGPGPGFLFPFFPLQG